MAEGIDAISPVGAYGSISDHGSGRRNKQGSGSKPPERAPGGTETSAEGAAGATDAAGTTDAAGAETLQQAVQQINEHLAFLNRALELRVDAGTGLTVAVIRNVQTGELLQQIPAEDPAQLAQMLSAWSRGGSVLLDLIA